MPEYDVLIIGAGGIGSAALYHFAGRGVNVCALEQYGRAHDLGSSHGETRIIRKAYFEHPDYVPLLLSSYAHWADLEAETGRELLETTGLVVAGAVDAPGIAGLERTYTEHDLPHQRLTAKETVRRYPQFSLPDSFQSFYDPDAGMLFVEKCITAHLERATARGATLVPHTRVTDWEASENGAIVHTERDTYRARSLVIASGAWATEVAALPGVRLEIHRKVQCWFRVSVPSRFRTGAFPIYYVDLDYGSFYGFPVNEHGELKIAEHLGLEKIDGPDALDRKSRDSDIAPVERFLRECLPEANGSFSRASVCMYTKTLDEHFVIDRHPAHPNVYLALGFSGHGFKFAPVVGEALAELVLDGATHHPIDFLKCKRFKDLGAS